MVDRTGTLFVSAARTLLQASNPVSTRRGYKGVAVYINISARAGASAITVTIEEQNPLTGTWLPVLVSAALNSVSHNVLKVYPGITVAANLTVSQPLPETWRVSIAVANGDSMTYSVSYALLD